MATRRRMMTFSPSYTDPMPPVPRRRISRYLPSMTWPASRSFPSLFLGVLSGGSVGPLAHSSDAKAYPRIPIGSSPTGKRKRVNVVHREEGCLCFRLRPGSSMCAGVARGNRKSADRRPARGCAYGGDRGRSRLRPGPLRRRSRPVQARGVPHARADSLASPRALGGQARAPRRSPGGLLQGPGRGSPRGCKAEGLRSRLAPGRARRARRPRAARAQAENLARRRRRQGRAAHDRRSGGIEGAHRPRDAHQPGPAHHRGQDWVIAERAGQRDGRRRYDAVRHTQVRGGARASHGGEERAAPHRARRRAGGSAEASHRSARGHLGEPRRRCGGSHRGRRVRPPESPGPDERERRLHGERMPRVQALGHHLARQPGQHGVHARMGLVRSGRRRPRYGSGPVSPAAEEGRHSRRAAASLGQPLRGRASGLSGVF